MNYNCLVVDDEEAIAQSISEYFELFGVSSTYVTGFQPCLDFFKEHTASILLLDINLNHDSGFILCKKLRETMNIPILFISARTSDEDILTALNIGGDDYIQKPFSLNILLAKVKAMLKRCEYTPEPDKGAILTAHDIEINCANQRVTVNQVPVKLKDMEYKLLLYLMKSPNRVISKDELLEQVWQDTYIGEGTISVHIRHLREKIEKNPDSPQYIKTVWGTGYLFEVL